MIPFNVPCTTGTELKWVQEAIRNGHISGNGPFSRKVQALMAEAFGFEDVFPTHSCTGALEMAAMCCEFQPGDEVILPSFTHVGTANAFERAGATLVFADSRADHPNVDAAAVAACISPRTRAIVVVHYAGMACDMEAIGALVAQHNLILVEDAAHALGARYKGRYMGSFGHLAAFSFHETKNITCGQGGMLVVNDARFHEKAAVAWENGTNRAAFFRGEVGQYTWVGTGSCFTLSDLNAAYLYGQLCERESILKRRKQLWARYQEALSPLAANGLFQLPIVPEGADCNGHIFYLRMANQAQRDQLIQALREQDVMAVFHYIPLHSSPHFADRHHNGELPNCREWSENIVRLPIYHGMTSEEQERVIAAVLVANRFVV
ncbi:MAG: dTDP-4-amino-4,6-dideoxygalactose transaminase [Bacteroidetes bacterium]|nr:dTDP-4-amino-4,6-dideoxygalactose transaminase [Bacteroidota bacterium]